MVMLCMVILRLILFVVIVFGSFVPIFAVAAFAEDDLRYPFLEGAKSAPRFRQAEPRPRYIAPQRIEVRSLDDNSKLDTTRIDNPTRRIAPIKQPSVIIPSVDAEKPPEQASIIVTVIGDSWGVQLGQGLREAFASKPEIGIANKARSETGLVNTSLRDWPKFTRELTAGAERNNLTIMMIGSNDNQPIRDETGTVLEQGSDKWKELYIKRVDEILNAFQAKKTPFIWVGAPITKLEKLNSNLIAINKIYRERTQSLGFTYIESWEFFADSDGKYSNIGPDINGINVKLRSDDNVHFTKAGARKLAFFVEKDLNTLLSGTALKIEPQIAPTLPNLSSPAAPILQSNLPQTQIDIRNALPLPDVAGLAPVLQKREAGPILPLTSLPITATNKLAERTAPLQQKNAATEVFERGLTPYPKPNRGDDFSWPRR
jgi:uncharacterized protein